MRLLVVVLVHKYAVARAGLCFSGMRVIADYVLCEANALCAKIAPQVFHVDEDDELTILQAEVPAELADQVRDAVARCPKMALSLDES